MSLINVYESDDMIMTETPKINDTKEYIAHTISDSLDEPNLDLIFKVISVLGKEKTLDIYESTLRIEENGGMMTANGSRRRTPGGVFFYLINHDPTISRETLKEVFSEEFMKQKERRNLALKERRKQKTNELRLKIFQEGLLTTLSPNQMQENIPTSS